MDGDVHRGGTGRVTEVEGGAFPVAVVAVDEQLRGPKVAASIRVNNNDIQAGATCGVEMRFGSFLESGPDEVILFLVPDEFGEEDWRLAAWGQGVLTIRDDRVARYPGQALLSDVRAAAVKYPYNGPVLPPATAIPSAPSGDGSNWWLQGGAAVAMLALVAVGARLARRSPGSDSRA